MAGITEQGFDIKTFQELFEELGNDEKALIDPNLDVTTNSVAGQFNAITSRQLALVWQAMQVIYNNYNPDAAEGAALDNLCKLTGIRRLNATYATTNVDVVIDNPTTLESDVFFASSDENPLIKFTPVTTFNAPSAGTYQIAFRSENRGPTNLTESANITNIVTPTFGVVSVDSSGYLITDGEEEESDIALRQRRAESLSISGSGTIDAIKADLEALTVEFIEQNGGYVKSAAVFEARSETTEFVEKIHSIKCVIDDDDNTDPEWNQLLAETIWATKPGGIETLGEDQESIIDDSGSTQIIKFQKVTAVPFSLAYTIDYKDEQPDDQVVKDLLAEELNAHYQIGETVIYNYVRNLPLNLKDCDTGLELYPNIIDVRVFTMNGSSTNVPINFDEKATFDADDITILWTQI